MDYGVNLTQLCEYNIANIIAEKRKIASFKKINYPQGVDKFIHIIMIKNTVFRRVCGKMNKLTTIYQQKEAKMWINIKFSF